MISCKNCGAQLNETQKFCPNCGVPVDNNSNVNSSVNVPAELGNEVNKPSENIGFNRNSEQDLDQFGFNNVHERTDNNISENVRVEQGNNITDINMNKVSSAKNHSNIKKAFPWIGIAIILAIVIVIGIFVVPILTIKTYENDDYVIKYNNSWTLDEEKEDMTLYYSDKDSKFIHNATATFTSLNFQLEDEEDKKTLYDEFYKVWSNLNGGKLTGGTDTFLKLTDESIYARIDYKLDNSVNVGAFYVVVSEKNNKVISFMSYCNRQNWDSIDSDVLKMLKKMTYKSEADNEVYEKFSEGIVKSYSSIGYIDYKIPDSWKLDEELTKANQGSSNYFRFRDGVSILDIKGLTPYDNVTMQNGTTYEKMKDSIIKAYGAVKEETIKTVNGKVWYVIITPDYTNNGVSYHNEIYFTLSTSNTNLYYVEAYVSNDTSDKKSTYFKDSIEYILESMVLHKVNE